MIVRLKWQMKGDKTIESNEYNRKYEQVSLENQLAHLLRNNDVRMIALRTSTLSEWSYIKGKNANEG